MWAQDWSAILDIALPYPQRSPYNITSQMLRQGYTPTKMFRLADNFYRSLGLDPVPRSFWRDSMLNRPRDRDVVCHASAWDMCNGRDYRVKMCTDITMEDFIKAHHELGHIQYDMLYRNQPFLFRTDLNHLFGVAVSKVAFLPFAFVLDKWRWRVFRGDITPDAYNAEWWRLRMEYSGVAPPVQRTERDFDPGAKYHVPANTPYIRYMVSFVLQFQLHEELCRAAQHDGPLHTCSIYGSQQAGELLR
ncbi:Peptidase M2 peptidyl-dipeptidase A, partial [Trinorchestia longiramus]